MEELAAALKGVRVPLKPLGPNGLSEAQNTANMAQNALYGPISLRRGLRFLLRWHNHSPGSVWEFPKFRGPTMEPT